jgi:hypothetical protein
MPGDSGAALPRLLLDDHGPDDHLLDVSTVTSNLRACEAGDGQLVLVADHFFPPGNPAFPSAPARKSVPSVSSPLMAERRTFAINAGLWFSGGRLHGIPDVDI